MAHKCTHFLNQGPCLWLRSHEADFVTEGDLHALGVSLTPHCSPFSLKDPLLCLFLSMTTSAHLRLSQETGVKKQTKTEQGLIPAFCPGAGSRGPAREGINIHSSNTPVEPLSCVRQKEPKENCPLDF